MRLLIYVEPHPTRDGFMSHYWIAHAHAQALRTAWENGGDVPEVRILANRHIGEAIARDLPDLWPLVICPSAEQSGRIDREMTDWTALGMRRWVELLEGRGGACRLYRDILSEVKRSLFDFDTIAVWGDNGAVTAFARKHRVRVLYMELGSTRAPFAESVLIDHAGVNGSASSAALHIADLRAAVTPLGIDTYRALLSSGRTATDRPGIAESRFFSLPDAWNAGFGKTNGGMSILLPLQLADDSNLLIHSPFATPLEMLRQVLPRARDAGATVLIKPHPAVAHRACNVAAQEDCERYAAGFPNAVMLDSDIPGAVPGEALPALLDTVDAVVTTNSTIGFEALLLRKPVCILGDAVYKIRGVFPSLDALLAGSFDRARYQDDIEYVVDYLLSTAFLPLRKGFDPLLLQMMAELFDQSDRLFETDRPAWIRERYRRLCPDGAARLRRHGLSADRLLAGSPAKPPPNPSLCPSPWTAGPDGGLLDRNGRPISIVPDAHASFVDFIRTTGTELSIGGWAVDWRTRLMPKAVVATLPGRVLWQGPCTVERPDVRDIAGLPSSLVGFGITLHDVAELDAGAAALPSLRLFAVSEKFDSTQILLGN